MKNKSIQFLCCGLLLSLIFSIAFIYNAILWILEKRYIQAIPSFVCFLLLGYLVFVYLIELRSRFKR